LFESSPNLGKKATDYYQNALQAYLTGDYDQAILLDCKALEINPKYKKANSLLSVLISEKEKAKNTVIWIGGKKVLVDKNLSVVNIVSRKARAGSGLDSGKLKELENRIQTVALLMARDSYDQYHELSSGQVQNSIRLDEVSKQIKDMGEANQKQIEEREKDSRISFLLSLLALVISLFALWISRKTRRDQKRQFATLARNPQIDHLGNVVNLNR
jgi:hypothetical protein